MAALRFLYRLLGFACVASCAGFDFLFRIRLRRRGGSIPDRTAWCHRWGRAFLKVFGVNVRTVGEYPSNGLLASNHLSYLDIVVYASRRPFVFVSKAEVQRWPLIGPLTRCAGTLFIQRDQRSDVKRITAAFESVIRSGAVIVLFPEGTSTGGDRVLPFYSSLFDPAATHDWPVCPAWIGYEVPGGDASEQVAYWKDMTFLPHLLRLLTLKEIRASIRVGSPLRRGLGRKEMARQLQEQVCQLARDHGRVLADSGRLLKIRQPDSC